MLNRPHKDLPLDSIKERALEIKANRSSQDWSSARTDLGRAIPEPSRSEKLRFAIKKNPYIGPLAIFAYQKLKAFGPRRRALDLIKRVPPLFKLIKWAYMLVSAPKRIQENRELLLSINHQVMVLHEKASKLEDSRNKQLLDISYWSSEHNELSHSVKRIGDELQRLEDVVLLLPETTHNIAKEQTASDSNSTTAPSYLYATLDGFYKAFEEEFRGTSEDITQKQWASYQTFIDHFGEGNSALDIGCGRGEWLQLMEEKSIRAKGVDLTASMILECESKGLDVSQIDGISYLKTLKAESLDLITGFHVAEHIPFEQLMELLILARRALKPDGMIILETPNPENLQVGAHSFYTDPTHLHPLPPSLLAFAAKNQGFSRTHIERLHPWDTEAFLDDSNASQVLKDLCFGPQDYALIAWK